MAGTNDSCGFYLHSAHNETMAFATQTVSNWAEFADISLGFEDKWVFRGQTSDDPLSTSFERVCQDWDIEPSEIAFGDGCDRSGSCAAAFACRVTPCKRRLRDFAAHALFDMLGRASSLDQEARQAVRNLLRRYNRPSNGTNYR